MSAIWKIFPREACILRTQTNIVIRLFASEQPLKGLPEKPDPTKVTCDYIGPPYPISNIRQYVRHIAKDETPLVRKLREKQIEVEKWNHGFWAKHNKSFYMEKEKFIKEHGLEGTQDNYQDKLSEFYKIFLDKNRKRHMDYNWAWYRRNFEMLTLMFRIEVEKIMRSMTVSKKIVTVDEK